MADPTVAAAVRALVSYRRQRELTRAEWRDAAYRYVAGLEPGARIDAWQEERMPNMWEHIPEAVAWRGLYLEPVEGGWIVRDGGTRLVCEECRGRWFGCECASTNEIDLAEMLKGD